jgi:hypothetical protein
MLRSLLTFLTFFAAGLTVNLHAQTVRWELGAGTLALNQTSELSLIFEQCEPADTFKLPSVPGLSFVGQPNRSTASSYSVVNFKATSLKTITLTYQVRPNERRPIRIPTFQVDTDKGRQTVAAAEFETGDATVGQSNVSLDSIVQTRFSLPAGSVWAGEVFPLNYTLHSTRRYFYQLGSAEPEWSPAPLSVEPWSKPEATETNVNNEQRLTITYNTRAYAKTPGSVALSPATQLVNLTTGAPSGFGLFARQSLDQFSITSQPASLTVRPLPAPAPAGFTGAVGKFTLESKVVPATAGIGEPITWTLTLDGTGNWPDISGLPSRSVSKDFRLVQPQAKRTNKDNALFDASITEDIILIPTRAGSYTLGPVSVVVFNPSKGAYETLSSPAVTIQVADTPAAANGLPSAPSAQAPTGSAGPSNGERAKLPAERSAAPAAAIPRDPLPPSGTSASPLATSSLLLGLVSAALLPLGFWLTLARRRARQTDPGRPLREAHDRLSSTLSQLADSSKLLAPSSKLPARSAQLLAWQRDTAIIWKLAVAVPTPSHFTDTTWSTLWSEADRTLYGAADLPTDWIHRAQQALAARPAPAFSTWQLFIPRNLLPLLILAAVVLPSPESQAADARDAYAKADFAAAETAWTTQLKNAPTDWSAHHNLALALLQQNRANEAAGHALAAFVQQPQNASVNWHLGYAWKAAGVTPAALSPFLTDAPTATVARLASPTQWQAALLASAWLTAVALALRIFAAYHPSPKSWPSWLVRSLFAVSILLALAAGLSLKTYGPLSDAHAVVVVKPTTLRSIPTELDTPQKSTPLAVGVVASTDKTFLGWRRIAFTDGQTGWVRAETLVPLWQP